MSKEKQVERTHHSVQTIAIAIDVSDETVLRWIHSGDLKAFNISKRSTRPRWRIAQSDLDTFLETRSNQTNPDPPPRRKRPKPKHKFV